MAGQPLPDIRMTNRTASRQWPVAGRRVSRRCLFTVTVGGSRRLFFVLKCRCAPLMGESRSRSMPSIAQQVAIAIRDFQHRRTGHAPGAVNVVLSNDTVVVTLQNALTSAERLLSQTPKVRPRSRSITTDCSTAPWKRSNGKSNGSQGCPSVRPRQKSIPARAPSFTCSRPAPWCRCSSSQVDCRPRAGDDSRPFSRPEWSTRMTTIPCARNR